MAQSISQASQALDKTLQKQLAAKSWGDSSGTWQSTGSGGARLIYPQGTVSSNVNDGYYYPTFNSFDVTVDNNDGTYTTGPGTLTGQLAGIYQNLVYASSSAAQEQYTKNANAIQDKINEFFGGNWYGSFGQSSLTYTNNKETSAGWNWVQLNAKPIAQVSPSEKITAISNSLNWTANQAWQNKDIALTSKFLKQNPDMNLGDFFNYVNGGTFTWDSVFTGMLNAEGMSNPWNTDLYGQYVQINNEVNANNNNATTDATNSATVSTASQYLQTYISGTNSNMAGAGNYAPVYTSGQSTETYPNWVPQVTYQVPPQDVQKILTSSSPQDNSLSASVYSADKSSSTVQIGTSRSSASSVSASSSSWFWTTSVKSSAAESKTSGFASYDSASSATEGTFDFGNSYYQEITIPQSGSNAWLLVDAIQGAWKQPSPYYNSPNFKGGYGFTDSQSMGNFLSENVTYVKSLAYSGAPTTTIKVQSDSEGGKYWDASAYSASSLSTSAGFGFDSWFGGVSIGSSASSSSANASASSSSTWDAASSSATVVSNPMGPISASINNQNAGYPAMQLGAQVVDVTDANPNFSTASNKGPIKTNWHVAEAANSGKNIKLDKSDNIVFGSRKRDVVKSSGGDDEIYGGKGRDALTGGKGNDFISGGDGKDVIFTGPGKDYVELHRDHFDRGMENIMDFNPLFDTLWFVHVNPDLLTTKGRAIYFDGTKIARFDNLNKKEVAAIVEDNSSFIG